MMIGMTQRWEYARLEYRSTGSLGNDRAMDWRATFYHPGGTLQWGVDERFDDLPHLNRAGAAGWQVYDRATLFAGTPQRMYAISYSMCRELSDS